MPPKTLAERLILRWIRNHPKNVNCPLTQDKLEKPIFRYITDLGYVHGYCLASLLEWIKIQGKPIDPVTKNEYNIVELKRMDREAKQHGLLPAQSPTMYELCTDAKHQQAYEMKREHEAFQSLSAEEKTEILAEQVQNAFDRLRGLYEVNDMRLFGHSMDYCETAGHNILALAMADAKRCEAEVNEFQTWLITTRCKAPSPLRCGIQGFMGAMEQAVIAATREEKNQMYADDILDVALASVDVPFHEPPVRRRRTRDETDQDESERPSQRRRR
jgi:hypothetical protein